MQQTSSKIRPNKRRLLDVAHHYTSKVMSASCSWDFSTSSMSSLVTCNGNSGSTDTTAARDTPFPTPWPACESPNSAITAAWKLWVAAWKLASERVGMSREEVVLGCAFRCRSRWKRQMMITDRLHIFSRRLQCMIPTHLFWIGVRIVARAG
jgi:hypothetical protein